MTLPKVLALRLRQGILIGELKTGDSMTAADVAFFVLPFGIEADHPRMSDLLLQSVPGVRLRSSIDGAKGIKDPRTGDVRIPIDQSTYMASCPRVPGMQIHVNPKDLQYAVIDPLYADKDLLERIKRWLKEKRGASSNIAGVPPTQGTVDLHRMKTLCRELVTLVNNGEAKKVKGSLPDLSEVASMPGYFLLNPGLRTNTTQPIYEHQFEDWVHNLSHTGG